MEETTVAELLMKQKRLEIIQFLLNNRDDDFTIREIAQQTEVSYTTVHGVIQKLDDFGIVSLRKKGPSSLVTLNNDSPYISVFEKLGSLTARPLKEAAKEYAAELADQYPNSIEGIILFGSVANGIPTSDSDIDLFIVLHDSVDEGQADDIEEHAHSLADKYARKQKVSISPLVADSLSFRRELQHGAPLENRIQQEGELLVGKTPW